VIVDSNTLFGFWPRRKLKADLESVKAEAASHGIAKSCVCSIRGIFTDHTEGNEETLQACAADPSLVPVVTLNPHRWLDLEKEIEIRLTQGVQMFRFFPEYQHWPYAFMPFYRVLSLLEGSGSIVVCPARVGGHQTNGVMTQLATLAGKYDLKFLITGIYYGNMAEAIAVAQSEERIFLETHLLNSPDGFEILVEEVGAERLMYGSLSPLHNINTSLFPLLQANIGAEDRDKILYGNIARELGWERCS
jgi:predicted TIM-barrel fold metal-dependent hydrolase